MMLPFDTALALVSFAFVSSVTPGPNNLMLAASGVNFGFRRTLPHMAGVCLGFAVLLVAVGLGLGGLFAAWPQARIGLKIAGALYLLWLAWKIATAGHHAGPTAGEDAQPMSFLSVCGFQWVNPKGWVMALGCLAVFVRPDHPVADVLSIALVMTVVTIPCVVIWAGFGHALGPALREPARLRAFNVAMALLLVASIVPMIV